MAAWVLREAESDRHRIFKERLQKLCLFVSGAAVTATGAIVIIPQLLFYSFTGF